MAEFVALRGTVIHYEDTGPRDAPAIAFSNSLGTDLRLWDRLMPALGPRFRCIRYDKRGHGLSAVTPLPEGPGAMAELAADLGALLDHLRVGRVVVCGLSVGGLIAQALAERAPERIAGLILSDTAALIGPAEMWEGRIATVEADGLEAIADGVMTRWFPESFRAAHPAELAGWRAMMVRTPAAGYTGICAAIRDADQTAASAAITAPALAIVGSEDLATPPELVRALAGTIPGCRFRQIDGAGHLPAIDKHAEMLSAILPFLTEIGHG